MDVGPIAHVHKSADESFYLISGSLEFLNGDQTFMAHAGDFVFVPRGTRHRFRNLADEQAYMVSFFTPGGGEGLWLEGGDDPVPGAKPEFWPPERGLALGPRQLSGGPHLFCTPGSYAPCAPYVERREPS